MDWREQMARLYLSDYDLAAFRAARDALFAGHPQSPIPVEDRPNVTGLRYFPPNPTAIVDVPLSPATGTMSIDTGGPDGIVP